MGRHAVSIEVGTRFGLLVTTSEVSMAVSPNGGRRSRVLVRCDCGTEKEMWTTSLTRNVQKVTSCGCVWFKLSSRECSLEDCHEKHFGLGFCREHYWEEVKDERNAAHREWMHEHHENRRADKARRRARSRADMDKFDIELSVAYRKAIKNDPCFYCGEPGEHDDHYQALADGGTDHWWNLVRACRKCNQSKHTTHGDTFRSTI
jgi:5-methylcytosine-specific restriction endonuclease McrA